MKLPAGIALAYFSLATSVCGAEVLSVENVADDYQLFITVWQGDVDIESASDDTVSVDVSCPDADVPEVNKQGLRVVSNDQAVPELRKSDDRVTFTTGEDAGRCRVIVSAPATIETQVRINDDGEIAVGSWRAMLTAWSAGGNVTLKDQQAPFSVTAMNGNANIEYRGATLDDDSAATAANGVVSLSLAAEPPMTLRTQARWGEVATNLDAPFSREQVGDATWSVVNLAGGGPTVTLRNLNSDIVITRAE